MVSMMTLSIGATSAQDFRKAMRSLHDKYKNANDLRISLSVEAFSARETQSPFYREKVMVSKKGTSYHHKLTGTDMIMNDKYMVVVDHSARQIVVNKRDTKSEASFNMNTRFNLDSILQYYEGGRFEGSENSVDKYSVTQKIGDIQLIELFVRQDSGHLSKINYLYRGGQWVTIAFSEFDLSPVFDPKEFDEQQFVRKAGKSWQPAVAMTGYRIVQTSEQDTAGSN